MDGADLNEDLLGHLIVEFGERGRRAVEFLRTAAGLLRSADGADSARNSNCAAYCLREALKTLPEDYGPRGGGPWRVRSRAVVDAKQRFELVRGLPGADTDGALRELLVTVDELALTHQEESIHQKRLIAAMIDRAGTEPLASGTNPVNTYQDLLGRLDPAVHGDVEGDVVRGMWAETVALLRQLFLPPEARHTELARLAGLDSPSDAELDAVLSILATPIHLQFFLARINGPRWLELLDARGLLEPAGGQVVWPVFAAVERLGSSHAEQLATLLGVMVERWGADPDRTWAVARAALELGTPGRGLVLQAARRHRRSLALAWLALDSAQKAEPASTFVQDVADLVISSAAQFGLDVYLKPFLATYAAGVTADTYAARLLILCYKLRKTPESDRHRHDLRLRGGSITDPSEFGDEDLFPSLVHALVESLRRAAEFAAPAELLEAVSELPPDMGTRARAWVLATWGDGAPGLQVAEVTKAIATRPPTGDDAVLVDRVVEHRVPGEYAGAWTAALGEPPSTAALGTALASDDVPRAWLWAFQWTALLPEAVTAAWATAVAVLAGAYGEPSRGALEHRPRVEFDHGRSPLGEDELRAMSPEDGARWIAGWRRGPKDRWTGPRELARTLEAVVKSDPAAWAARPLRTGSLLREPTYIGHYLRGLSTAESLAGVGAGELVELIVLCSTHPWKPIALGDSTYDYDPDWREAESAAVDVITTLARQNLGFGGRDDEVWAFLDRQARARERGADVSDGDPLTAAINRRCTRALGAVCDVMGYDYRQHEAVRPEALALLTDALSLTDADGAQHRAVIAPRLAFLRYVAPSWVEANDSRLFGLDAPEDLGQTTVDLALWWGQPNSWLLGHHRDQALDAVRRSVTHALEHVMVAMLWQVEGYAVRDTQTFLRSIGKLSDAGETMGRLLRTDEPTAEHLTVAAAFWEAALKGGSDVPLGGFGWYSEITALDADTWTRLTRQTLSLTRGRIDWARHVAERAARQEPSEDTLEILSLMVSGLPDGWDQRSVLESAIGSMRLVGDSLKTTPEYLRLHTRLLERGADLGTAKSGAEPSPPEAEGGDPEPGA